MVDISSYILIFASVVVFGYSLSRFIDNYGALQQRIHIYRSILQDLDESPDATRRANVVQNVCLLLSYALGAYFAQFAFWVLTLIVAKFSVSCILSDRLYGLVLDGNASVSRTFYWLHKSDSLLNAALCVFILIAIVS